MTAAVAATLPGAGVHRAADNLLADPRIDAVLFAGPNTTHAVRALAALTAGKHVLIERRMCLTLATARAKAGRVVQVGYVRRHAPAFEEAVGGWWPRRASSSTRSDRPAAESRRFCA